MALATNADVNAWLPQDKATLADANDDLLLLGAEREIKATLAGVVDLTTLASWSDPSSTPGIIREIAARLTAGMWYMERNSEDDELKEYGVQLANWARNMLAMIVAGTVSIISVDDTAIVGGTGSDALVPDDFLPNDTSSAIAGGERKFGMGDQF